MHRISVRSAVHPRLPCWQLCQQPAWHCSPSRSLRHAGGASASKALVEECSVGNWRQPLHCQAEALDRDSKIIVALGKFDAMHRGHRSLAVKAAELGGYPFLLSFSGMAEVLGWPPRLPLVAPCDRARVLRTWAQHCHGKVPRQRTIPFHEIRHMQPQEFVALLARDFKAAGVVAGYNYRFGYRAKGDAAALQQLGRQYDLDVAIVQLVGDAGGEVGAASSEDGGNGNGDGCSSASSGEGPVSSSRIRELLAKGSMDEVAACLARPYRLVAQLPQDVRASIAAAMRSSSSGSPHTDVAVPASALLNQPPADGAYDVRVQTAADSAAVEGLEDTAAGMLVHAQLAAGNVSLQLPHAVARQLAAGMYLTLDFGPL